MSAPPRDRRKVVGREPFRPDRGGPDSRRDPALRAVGARRLLQALKDDARVVGLFFRPADAGELPALGEAAGEPLAEGVWLVAAARGAARRPEADPAGGAGGRRERSPARLER